ncbi:MAG: hypothetical protein CMJ30_00080 [Phycisphaerae bacterium]|jgi:D-arabinose 1-dehydrogenase-like Zn-dependent alcohol dehydrogenase|nr:hypothetical protein [Phycisphaerae bacterium]
MIRLVRRKDGLEVEPSTSIANIQPIRCLLPMPDASTEGRTPGGVFVARHDSRGLVISDPHAPCRSCSRCTDGLSEACLQRRCPGRGMDEGGLAERQLCAEELLIDVPADVDPDVAIWSSEAATALGAMRSVVPGDRPYVSVVGDSAAAILAGELGSQRDSRFRLLCQRDSTLKEAERRGIRVRLLSDVGQHGDQDVLVLLDGALEVPSLLPLLRPRGRLVLARPPRVSVDFSTLYRQQLTVVPSAASSVRSGFDAFMKGVLRADGLAERVLALEEVGQWWQKPRARTLVRIGATL